MEKHNTEKVVLAIGAILILVLAIFLPNNDLAYIAEVLLSLFEMGIIIRMLGRKDNCVKVVLVAIMIFLLLSWIIPAAYYSGEYMDQGRVQMGLFDLFNYPLTAFSYFGYIALFFILVGGFYGVLYKIPAYRNLLDKVSKNAVGHEYVALAIMILMNAFLVSFCGLHIGIALLIPFEVSIILLLGYDKNVAAMVTVGSIVAGLIGSTFAYGNLSILLESFSLKLDYQIGVRIVLLLMTAVLVLFNTIMYIKNNISSIKIEKKTVKKVEKNVKEEKVEEDTRVKAKKTTTNNSKSTKKTSTSKSNSSKKSTAKSTKSRKNDNKAALKDEDIIVVKETRNFDEDSNFMPEVIDKNQKSVFLTCILSLLFIIFVLAFVTWGDNGFKIKLFDDVTSAVTGFELFGFPIFGKILGTINSFGNWTITDLFLPMALALLLLVIVYSVSFEEAFDGFVTGAKKALLPASLVILLYTILVLVTYHPFQTPIYKAVLGLDKGFNIATSMFVAVLASLFNSDISYSFQSVVPYYVSVVTDIQNYSLSGIIFQAMYGLTMLVAPTSLVLMATLSYLGISYKDWMKNIWKLLLELFIVLIIVFIILALI